MTSPQQESPSASSLPQHAIDQCWTCHYDTSQHPPLPFFHNHLTNKTQWETPLSFTQGEESLDSMVSSFYQFCRRNGIDIKELSDSDAILLMYQYQDYLTSQNSAIQVKFRHQFNSKWNLVKLSNEEFFYVNLESGVAQWKTPPLHELDRNFGSTPPDDNAGTTQQHSHSEEKDSLKKSPAAPVKLTPQEKFQQLLEESNITKLTPWSSVEPQLKKDPRFHGLKPKQRKILFMKHVRNLMKS